MNTLPVWLQWMQALALPAIAAVGARLAWQQYQLARVKLQHDLYDRRYAVFKAAQDFLQSTFHGPVPSAEAFRDFAIGTAQAVFLFDDEMEPYLKGITDRMLLMRHHHETAANSRDEAERERASKDWVDDREWLNNEFPVLVERFKPFLRLDRLKL